MRGGRVVDGWEERLVGHLREMVVLVIVLW